MKTKIHTTTTDVRNALYMSGVLLATAFLRTNRIPLPVFHRYDDAIKPGERAFQFLEKVRSGPVLGTGSGVYWRQDGGFVFVNVPITALPVQSPRMRSWSWPGWKTDRTAIGVVAHEVGHHVEQYIYGKYNDQRHDFGAQWRSLLTKNRKRVSSYEPVPSESWAETMRLFMLNPDLLRRAIPERYEFITQIVRLKPSEKRNWKKVLFNPAYIAAGERWIAK